MVPPTFKMGLLLVNPLEMSSKTHPEVCFTNLLGVSLPNHVDSQDYLSQRVCSVIK
jgi:hypothetical protein